MKCSFKRLVLYKTVSQTSQLTYFLYVVDLVRYLHFLHFTEPIYTLIVENVREMQQHNMVYYDILTKLTDMFRWPSTTILIATTTTVD